MKNLLLVSSSKVHGSGYLDACEAQVRELFDGRSGLLFVPYALHDLDAYASTAIERFDRMGFEMSSIHTASDPRQAVRDAGGIFIGGGNTFRLLERLYGERLMDPIRARVDDGMPYMGTSAGSNVACITIKTTNDMPITYPPSFDALGLVPFNINPHYLDPDPASTHMGETRETRIREFHEMNSEAVVGLREGAMLRVRGEAITLEGTGGARLFRQGQEAVEVKTGESLDFLWEGGGPGS
jgi:dipeptidase E